MFDISEKLILEQSDEIHGVNTIHWCDSSWKHSSLICDEEVVSLSHAKVYDFSDSVLCLGKLSENPQSNTVWEDKLTWFKSSSQLWTQLMVSQWVSSGIFSDDSLHCSSSKKSNSSWTKWANNSKDKLSSCRCSTTSHGDLKAMNGNAIRAPKSFRLCEMIFTRKMAMPRTWIKREVVFYSSKQPTRRLVQSRRVDDDKLQWKRTPSFSEPRGNAQMQRMRKIINTHFCWWGNDLKLFSYTDFC